MLLVYLLRVQILSGSQDSSVLDGVRGLNITSTNAIKRFGNIVGGDVGTTSWEDGHFGDSSKIVFTASDFSCINEHRINPLGASIPIISGIGNRAGRQWPILIVEAGATAAPPGFPSAGVRITATKLIPQGFFVPAENRISVYTCTLPPSQGLGGLTGIGGCTLEAYFGNINLSNSTTPPTNLRTSLPTQVTLANWTDGVSTDYLIENSADQVPVGGDPMTEPQGRRTIMLEINVPRTTELDFGNGLAGASVIIKRML